MTQRTLDAGQAAVESAITLPLTVFLILGTLQLFGAMQGRVMAQYAAMRATRAGSVNSGDCTSMLHTAVASLLPTFARTDDPTTLAASFKGRMQSNPGHYAAGLDGGRNETIVWIQRLHPLAAEIPPNEEEVFDLPEDARQRQNTLRVRMIFWYPLRIPFANWVFAHIVLAQWSLQAMTGTDPLLVFKKSANWQGGVMPSDIFPAIANELTVRSAAKHYVMPIQATYAMRMMSPPRRANFTPPQSSSADQTLCAPYP